MPVSQGKVSLVMPCYNKEKYLSVTFNTILAQDWNNIQLVLINDGSTDNTANIINRYVEKFQRRGYEVTTINQKNAGVCAAAKNGLASATGDYVCLIDADDELDPKYVSTMANWLDANKDCDFVICSAINFRDTKNGREFYHYPTEHRPKVSDNEIGPEHFFLGEIIRQTVWIYMVRTSYLRKCDVQKSIDLGIRGSHEPGYVIPILANKGNRKFIPLPLYNFNGTGDGYSRSDSIEHYQQYYDTYDKLSALVIASIPNSVATPTTKYFWQNCCQLSSLLRLYRLAVNLKSDDSTIEDYAQDLLNGVNSAFKIDPPLTREQINGKEYQLTNAIGNCIFDQMTPEEKKDFPQLCYLRNGSHRSGL